MKGLSHLRIVTFKVQQPVSDFTQVDEIIGREHLALHDRKIDLYLIEPTGVHRQRDRDGILVPGAQALSKALAAMRRSAINDPEYIVAPRN